jgi:hypothetical protein
MIGLLLHAVFTANMALLVLLVVWRFTRRAAGRAGVDRRRLVLASIAVVALRVAFIAMFKLALPDRGPSPDEQRYFSEIQQIAHAPWQWNPFTGTGPYYQVTAKMGMSYLYGSVLFLHRIDSLYGVLVLNVVFGLFTSLAVYLLTSRLSRSSTPAVIAMLLTAVYPETLFWTARVTRENMTLFLVPMLVYTSIRLFETYRLRHVVFALLEMAALLLVRAQLVMFAVLIIAFFGVRALLARNRARAIGVTLVASSLLAIGFSALKDQIRRAGGSEALKLLSADPDFWSERGAGFFENLGGVLSPVARGSYGAVGILMAPFALAVLVLSALTILRFRRIFAANLTAARLVAFLSVSFLLALALVGRVNIRFRSTVAPLLLSLISVSMHYYWTRLGLPRISMLSLRPPGAWFPGLPENGAHRRGSNIPRNRPSQAT